MLPLMLLACRDDADPAPSPVDAAVPDPAYVFEPDGHDEVTTDDVFLQERATLFRDAEALPDLDVAALVVGVEVYVGTESGLWRLSDGAFALLRLPGGAGSVADLAILVDGRVAVAVDDRLDLYEEGGGASWVLGGTLVALATDGETVWIGGDAGVWRIDEEGATAIETLAVTALALDAEGTLWMGGPTGLFRWSAEGAQPAGALLPDDDVRAIATLPDGGVVVGTADGAAVVGTDDDSLMIPSVGGLPLGDITAVATFGDLVLFGHGEGATVVQGDLDHVDHYHGLRWVPEDTVRDVAFGLDGARWVATAGGIARIEVVEATLAEKAERFAGAEADFARIGIQADQGWRVDPWNTEAALALSDFDNDGLWTQMRIAEWSYAFGATGDDAWCDRADAAMEAMYALVDVPAVSFEAVGREPGFVARSLVRDDEVELFAAKAAEPNWHLVEGWNGHDWYWKDDTSSDETTGHFFGTPLYYDLCADEDERARVRTHVDRLAGHIVDNGFRLVDLDGEPTTWGRWDPAYAAIAIDGLEACIEDDDAEDCMGAAYGGGWLQGIEILGHLLAAWHVTEDERYYAAYLGLLDEHRYAELVDWSDEILTVTSTTLANHSDHELALLAYATLIRYEPDDDRRARWLASLLAFQNWELGERSPLLAGIVAGATGEPVYALADAVDTLRTWPEDMRDWRMDNGHRSDAVDGGLDRFDEPQFQTVLPYDEIRTMKWNGNPFVVAGGGDGSTVQAPWPWLLPYWMARYHGIVGG